VPLTSNFKNHGLRHDVKKGLCKIACAKMLNKQIFTFAKMLNKQIFTFVKMLGARILSIFSLLQICLKSSPKHFFTFVPKVKKCLGLDSQANFHFCKIACSIFKNASKCSPQAFLQK
jgi:hypothetical protein